MVEFSPEAERSLYRSTIPQIILIDNEQSIEEQVDQALEVERLMRMVVCGERSIWEVIEAIEQFEFDIDQYVEEVCENMEGEIERGFYSPDHSYCF